ncbi:MAG: hypothetical protein OHK0023_22110 [Anaerolineae bacterium]
MVYLSKNLFDALSEFVAMPDPNTLSITIIPNLHRQTLQAMRDLGIFTIADLTEMTAADLDRLPRVGKATAQHIRQCVEALCQGEPLWLKAPDARAADDGIFFDVETDAMGEIWSIGWKAPSDAARCVVLDPNRLAEHRLLEDGTLVFTVPTRLAMWEMLHAVCVQHPSVPLYHWSPFEVGIVKKAGLPAPTAEISKRLLDLAKVVSQSVVLPIAKRRRGLKEVSSYLGFRWAEHMADGMGWWHARNHYEAWLVYGDLEGLTWACAYQRSDVDATYHVWSWLRQQNR